MNCLLISSYFPPVIGGSAKVYGNLYKYGKNKISVLTAQHDSNNGDLIPRNNSSNNIYTVKHLQSPNMHCRNTLHSIWALVRYDIPIQIKALLKTLSLIRKEKFNVICIGDLQMQGWMTLFLKKFTKSKVILFIHGEELSTKTSSRFLGKNAGLYLNKSDGIIAVSQFTKDIIVNEYGIPEDKICLISNGIDLDDYQQQTQPKEIIPRRTESDEILIFGIGRLIERKGFDKAIEAISLVKEKGYNILYVIAGTGDMQEVLKNTINKLNLNSTVSLVGKLSHEELTAYYQNCDIFLMPNRELDNGDTEGFGLVFLEANAFKKPVIGGSYGGAVDAIIHDKTGLLVDSNSIDEIADAVIKLINDKSLRIKLGDNGYEWSKQNDVKAKVDEFLIYCNSIAEN